MAMYLVAILSSYNKENKPLKMKCIKTDEAIYCSNDLGLNIDRFDLEINSNSNANTMSCADLRVSYKHSDYANRPDKAKSFLAVS